MEKEIQLLYNKGIGEVINRKSALGSYICILSKLLNSNYKVYVNERSLNLIDKKSEISKLISTGNGVNYPPKPPKWLYSLFPKYLTLLVKDFRSLFNSFHIIYKSYSKRAGVYIEFYTYLSITGYVISKLKKKPLIIIYDGPIEDEFIIFNNQQPPLGSLVHFFQELTLKQSKYVIVYSQSMADYINQRFCVRYEKIRIHQNVDFSRFDIIRKDYSNLENQKNICIGFIGSFLKWHRVDLLINAFSRLKEKGYNLKLILIGYGMELVEIKSQAESSKFKKDIIFTGFLDGEELKKQKERIDVGVMPSSNWYGAPAKIFEYGAAGMAVIAPNTPTISDLFVDGKELVLFENNSEEGLFRALEIFCLNRGKLKLFSSNLQEKVLLSYNERATFSFYSGLIESM